MERAAYRRATETYRGYIRRRRVRIDSPEDFQRFVVWPSANDPEARRKLRELSVKLTGVP